MTRTPGMVPLGAYPTRTTRTAARRATMGRWGEVLRRPSGLGVVGGGARALMVLHVPGLFWPTNARALLRL